MIQQVLALIAWMLAYIVTFSIEMVMQALDAIKLQNWKIKYRFIEKRTKLKKHQALTLAGIFLMMEITLFGLILAYLIEYIKQQIPSILVITLSLSLLYWVYQEFIFIPLSGETLKDTLKKTNPTIVNLLLYLLHGLVTFLTYLLLTNSII